jgi:lipoprotein-anchoring transpeptidase ErfK/SrfK
LLFAGTAAAGVDATTRYDAAKASDLLLVGHELRAGQFAWLPDAEARSDGPLTVWVNLRDQRASLYRDGRRIAVTTVSTGRPGYDTPTGVFPILGKERMHYSRRYENAPMPWTQRITEWGHALHAGNVRPYPASHGCIRLPGEFAKQLFSLTQPGDLVVITQDDTPRSLAIALAYAGMDNSAASMVGVTEPLPRIVFVRRGEQPPSGSAGEVGAGSVTAF